MTGLAILGSTGSIGSQTLEVVADLPGRFEVLALASGHATAAFDAQLNTHPAAVGWCADGRPPRLSAARWADGGLVELATLDGVELVVIATTGMAALPAVLAALDSGRRVALANKETLVTGGHLVATTLGHRGGDALDALRPVDSEHSAIWQCLIGERVETVRRLVLTASGGPFRGRDPSTLRNVTPAEALSHPTWRMGPKITVDSATLVNKAFEVIEAKWLYRLPYSKIEAVIHPQSVVHSLVEFTDGSYKAQLGLPDMKLPIQYALTHPDRLPSTARHGDPSDWERLDFAPLEAGAYPAYDIVRAAAELGGNRGAVINAADESAVSAFLDGRIDFARIGQVIEEAVARWGSDEEPVLDAIVALDAEVRRALDHELGASAHA